jgi:hypothetical protein
MSYFNWDQPNPEHILEYVKSHRKQGIASLDILRKGLHFLDAWNTQVGWELLCDLVKRHGELLEIIGGVDEVQLPVRIEYKILTELIHKWAAKIAKYESTLREVNGKIEKTN